ncbi:MAG: 23S rRNA (adenine(2030)-N(6))-methyltransferase RlmJ [Pseudomonadota bacterium]
MNYRHAYHAGNFADVFKHVILARIVEYLKRKDKAFRVYDTHAGLGVYDLASVEAGKTNEWQEGVGRILSTDVPEHIAPLLAPWLDAVSAAGEGRYPGSPMVARHLLRKQDRLSLYEMHDEDYPHLAQQFSGDYQVRVNHLDGWLAPGAHIAPKEARGMMLIDPPFEDGNDFDRMIDALEKARKRWVGGTMALWYPVKRRDHTDEWLGTLKGLKLNDLISAEIYIREPRSPSELNGCGMVIANAPYTLRGELGTLLPWLAQTMQAPEVKAGTKPGDKGFFHRHRVMDLSG